MKLEKIMKLENITWEKTNEFQDFSLKYMIFCRLLLPKINRNKSEREKALIKKLQGGEFQKKSKYPILIKKSDKYQINRFFRIFLEKIDYLPTLITGNFA